MKNVLSLIAGVLLVAVMPLNHSASADELSGCHSGITHYFEPTLIGVDALVCFPQDMYEILAEGAGPTIDTPLFIPPGSISVKATYFDFTRGGNGSTWNWQLSGLVNSGSQTSQEENNPGDEVDPSPHMTVDTETYPLDPTKLGQLRTVFNQGATNRFTDHYTLEGWGLSVL